MQTFQDQKVKLSLTVDLSSLFLCLLSQISELTVVRSL